MRNLQQWISILVAVSIVTLAALTACSSNAPAPAPASSAPAASASKDPYKIGLVASFSGFLASMGVPERDMILALEEKINADGGINGRPIKVIAYDDQSKDTESVLAAKKLMDVDKVLGIVGPSGTGFAMAVAPIVEDAQVPLVSMNSGKAPVLDKKYVFKLPISESTIVDGMFAYAKKQNFSKIAVLARGDAFGKEAIKYIGENVGKQGLQIVANETFGPDDKDMSPQLIKIRASGADMIILYSGGDTAGPIAAGQAKGLGVKMPIITTNGATGPEIMSVKELRDALEGIYTISRKPDIWQQLPDTDPMKKVIADHDALYRKKYNRPFSTIESLGADAFGVLVDAVKRANPDTSNLQKARQQVRDALEGTKNFVGAIAILSYTPTEHELALPGMTPVCRIVNSQYSNCSQ